METINNKTFSHRPISELMAIVKNSFKKFDDEGLIDEGTLIKTVMWCNDRLGIPLREIKQICIPVLEYKAKLPLNFEKLYYAAGLTATNTMIHNGINPFDNSFDRDVIYEAGLDRGTIGNTENYSVTIKRNTTTTIHNVQNFIGLDVAPTSLQFCHNSCPNIRKKGKYTISINDGNIETPFRSGEIYIMYLATMSDDEGNLLFPFHPMITPWYEWCIKEAVVIDAIFNSDLSKEDADYFLKLAQREKSKAWLDAFDMTTSKGYGEYAQLQKKKELGWYNQYFKFFQ